MNVYNIDRSEPRVRDAKTVHDDDPKIDDANSQQSKSDGRRSIYGTTRRRKCAFATTTVSTATTTTTSSESPEFQRKLRVKSCYELGSMPGKKFIDIFLENNYFYLTIILIVFVFCFFTSDYQFTLYLSPHEEALL